jgi:flavorubredoxin
MTRIDEIETGLFRIATDTPDGSFSFNQYLVVDDQPLLYHTGPRRLFPSVRQAVARVLDPARLAYLALSHVEGDECGALAEFLALAPQARPLCSRIAAMTSISDMVDREPFAMADGQTLSLGARTVRWIDAPHLPHGWESGMLVDDTNKVLFCGDLFTQPGSNHLPLVESDILGPSEDFRRTFDYYAHAPDTRARLLALAAMQPRTLACMHGSAWRGDGAALLRELAEAVSPRPCTTSPHS